MSFTEDSVQFKWTLSLKHSTPSELHPMRSECLQPAEEKTKHPASFFVQPLRALRVEYVSTLQDGSGDVIRPLLLLLADTTISTVLNDVITHILLVLMS